MKGIERYLLLKSKYRLGNNSKLECQKRIMSARIFVARLPTDVRESEIRDLFSKVRNECRIIKCSMEVLRPSRSRTMEECLLPLLNSMRLPWPKLLLVANMAESTETTNSAWKSPRTDPLESAAREEKADAVLLRELITVCV